jgi:hypothetical protein
MLFILAPYVSAQDYWFPRDTVKGSPKSAIAATSFQNIGLIIGGLDEFGFKRKMYSYSPFQDDWDEQVSLFSSTGILISSHGGDLAGIPFLPPSASVIEAFPYLMDWEGYRRVPPRARAHTTHMIAHTHVQGQ